VRGPAPGIARLETFHINLGGPDDTLFAAPAADQAGGSRLRTPRGL
jgi:hypothetical protein